MHSVSKDNFCPKTESDQYTSILEFWRENSIQLTNSILPKICFLTQICNLPQCAIMYVGGESRTFCVSETAANGGARADVFMLTTSEKMNRILL